MNLAVVDWLIIAGYYVLPAGIGLAYTRRAGQSVSEYFVSGRAVPWWLAVTFFTAPTEESKLVQFYRRVHPGGRGWCHVQERAGFPEEPIPGGALNWVAGVVSVYATLFGVGRLIFGAYIGAIAYLVVAGVAFAMIARNLSRDEPLQEPSQPTVDSPPPVFVTK